MSPATTVKLAYSMLLFVPAAVVATGYWMAGAGYLIPLMLLVYALGVLIGVGLYALRNLPTDPTPTPTPTPVPEPDRVRPPAEGKAFAIMCHVFFLAIIALSGYGLGHESRSAEVRELERDATLKHIDEDTIWWQTYVELKQCRGEPAP